MNTLTSLLGSLWLLAVSTGAGKLFLGSTLLLILGLGAEVWYEGRHLGSFTRISLKEIEARHPHVPAMTTIGRIILTNLELYIVSLLVFWGMGFLPDPREWMLFGGIFLAVVVAGVLVELHWKSAAGVLFAFSTATTAVALWIVMEGAFPVRFPLLSASLFILFTVNVILFTLLFVQRRDRSLPLMFLLTVLFWLLVAACSPFFRF